MSDSDMNDIDFADHGFAALAKACEIFAKYNDRYAPFHCEHDVFAVLCVDPEQVSRDDRLALEDLGFSIGDIFGHGHVIFYSYRFGSC